MHTCGGDVLAHAEANGKAVEARLAGVVDPPDYCLRAGLRVLGVTGVDGQALLVNDVCIQKQMTTYSR